MKIVADKHIPFVKEYFSRHAELELINGREIAHEKVKDADILLVRSVTTVDKKLLQKTKVKFVGSVTAGADHLDTEWLDTVGIEWQVAAGFNAPPVADYVVSVIAALQRKHLLRQKPLRAVVIGVGNVGSLVVERLRVLDFEVIYCDPIRAANEKDFNSIDINDIAEVDLISLHVPLTKSGEYPTWHLINEDFLRRQKNGCILLNASRGEVINFEDLAEYGIDMRWCFDVWANEPHIDKYFLENSLIATPHIAGYSAQSKVRGIDMIYQALCESKLIEKSNNINVYMPRQQLTFAEAKLTWREIVLGIFNPSLMTSMMQTRLLSIEDDGAAFDDMRHTFTYRHELAFTDVAGVHLTEEDQAILNKLRKPVVRDK